MQNPNLESVRTELQLIAEGKSSVLTALASTQSLEEAGRLERELRALPSVADVISLATFLPPNDPKKTEAISDLVQNRSDLMKVLRYLEKLPEADARESLFLMERFHHLQTTPEQQRFTENQIQELEHNLEKRGPGPIMDAFEVLRQDTRQKIQNLGPLLERQYPDRLTAQQLPESLTDRLLTRQGEFVLKIFPSINVWQPQHLKRFLLSLIHI